ncbi:alanyl-tRNA synthetase [Levilactobacillus senmaizukei DSM 21775 = NBRC 103853]|uniref:Alanine--tRNA ligase n=1 Tax=Levilactobacillus senmaizukei DSM 21775 = NBRC 103853 TaxID=1423803 RepID=A0A0R2DPW3_9LACO|nr:alanine--tRNA ligase [Levilactobacillus senmaizukei]KRN01892.1 alanyl-tRNA synthetase [Levilactobacillus senmaizukei DSM 21775 = NBRC 103853]
MKELSSSQIRQMYLDFFKSKGHAIEPSSSLVPKDDPSLLWINSGVATMKKYFSGQVVPENPRMTSSQKSIRTNDIENVGKTARHHTLFEMLGNFSVGDYFKKEAITWAWELLTSPDWFAWDPDKLYMTVYPKDTDAKADWEAAGVAPDHIIAVEDNFWDIGEGPSGPDSEIFYDRGQAFNNLADDDPENYPGGENERYLEVWNIVFSQFNHEPDGTYKPLPRKNIDTGMGLERAVSIFQNAKTNFETDLFLPIIEKTAELSDGKTYGENQEDDVAFKVIADHARAITFAIGDGAMPSNEGRGYVIRRLIRRAIVNGQKLGIQGAFLDQLVPVVGKIMRSYYPDVLKQADYIAKIIRSEEDRFGETLDGGLNLLNSVIADLKKQGGTQIDGADAFKLYDTYGFPVELTEEYADDQGITVDQAGFKAEMQKQKDRARNARGKQTAMGLQHDLLINVKTPSEYVGYTQLTTESAMTELVVDDKLADDVTSGVAQAMFAQTPFYAEMGGQVADKGNILDEAGNVVAHVTDVQHAPNGQNLHTLDVVAPMKKGTTYKLVVDQKFHSKVEKNHTATHLLDKALREVFGEHTQQAGSLVEGDYLRFDFTHFGQVDPADLAKAEAIVNEKIFAELPVTTVETDIESAKKMGAIALFSEKYGKVVRVVSAGDFVTEFCGGNHVKNTNEIGLFKIVSEAGVGAGVRRIEAVTSAAAYNYLHDHDNILQAIGHDLKVNQVTDTEARVQALQAQVKALQQKQAELEGKLASQEADSVFDQVTTAGNYRLISGTVQVSKMDQLRALADKWREQALSDVLVLGAEVNGKANLIVAVSADKQKQVKAGDLIKAISPKIDGGGGGRPNLAQAGGKNPTGLPDAMTAATTWLEAQD